MAKAMLPVAMLPLAMIPCKADYPTKHTDCGNLRERFDKVNSFTLMRNGLVVAMAPRPRIERP